MTGTIVTQPHAGFTFMDPFLTPSQQQRVAGYRRLQAEAERRGWSPASVISLHCFGWPVTGPIHQVDIRIPAVPLSKEHWMAAPKLKLASGLEVPYAQYVFAQWKPLQQKYLSGAMLDDCEEVNDSGHIWPIDQADDAIKQNSMSADRGGAFCYEGAHVPGSRKETADLELAQFTDAHSKLMFYYEGQHEKFMDAYGSRNSTNSWKDLAGKGKYHRWIAQYLTNIGRLAELPTYCQEYSSPTEKKAKCDQCLQNVEPGSVVCRHCNRVLNPFEAFAKLMIDSDTPGAKLAAKRLTVTEVKTLIEGGRLTEEQAEVWGLEHKGKGKGKSESKN